MNYLVSLCKTGSRMDKETNSYEDKEKIVQLVQGWEGLLKYFLICQFMF